jgi:hypothetical protein
VRRRAEYRHLLELADTWTSVFFWPLRPDEPDPPFQASFASLRENRGALPEPTRQRVEEITGGRRLFQFELAFPDVFTEQRGGFDLVIGNPPYLGGMKISGTFGVKVLHFLKSNHPADTGGREDLAAFFVRRGFDLLRLGGNVCFVTTNSIGEGDTRDAALAPITAGWGGVIVNAIRSMPWEGDATVSVSIVHLHRGDWAGPRTLDGATVDHISANLTADADVQLAQLPENAELVVKGTNLVGIGFVLTAKDRDRLLADDPENWRIIKAFLGAKDIRDSPTLTPSRWVIDFGDMSLAEAEQFREPMRRVIEKVKPDRDRAKEKRVREGWWKFGRPSANLYARIDRLGLSRVLVIPETSKHALPVRVPVQNVVFFQSLFVFTSTDESLYGTLTSSIHRVWVAREATTMREATSGIRYSGDPCFTTFVRPGQPGDIPEAMDKLDRHRSDLMQQRRLALTALYNRLDDQAETDPDIVTLRDLHTELDRAVLRAYDWGDLADTVRHGHHPLPKFGDRWTVDPDSQAVIEARLLHLNLALSLR